MDVIFLVSIYRLHLKVKSNFFHNCIRRNLLLSASCWDRTIAFREVDQKCLHVGKVGYGHSYFDSVFRYSKVIRLHSLLHDATGAVRLQIGKGPGYCYMINRGPNSCLLSHMTGLLFCLYVKVFLPSDFNLVDI